MQESEGRSLQDNLERFAVSAATARKDRDLLIATWRDNLVNSLKMIGTGEMIPTLHRVIDNMDEYLRRSKHDGVW